jgi:hypothetical protein
MLPRGKAACATRMISSGTGGISRGCSDKGLLLQPSQNITTAIEVGIGPSREACAQLLNCPEGQDVEASATRCRCGGSPLEEGELSHQGPEALPPRPRRYCRQRLHSRLEVPPDTPRRPDDVSQSVPDGFAKPLDDPSLPLAFCRFVPLDDAPRVSESRGVCTGTGEVRDAELATAVSALPQILLVSRAGPDELCEWVFQMLLPKLGGCLST